MSRKGVVQIEVICKLDAEDCKPWDELTPAQQEEQAGTGPGCDGTGEFSGLCLGCDFCLDWETLDACLIGMAVDDGDGMEGEDDRAII